MDTPTAGALLREVARLHAHSQREQVACCNGTTSTQCLILTEVGRNGPLTLADLGRRTSLDKGWLSRAVETLVQEGLLTKALGDADRRTIRIALSPAGQTRHQQLNETLNAHAERVMARIPPAEREQVAHTLARLYQALQAEAAATAGLPTSRGGPLMSSWIMRRATPHDWPKLAALLTTADLPLAGAQAHLSDFFLAFRGDVLIGSAGLEHYGDTALLRSVAVASTERGHGLGQALVQQMLAYAASLGVRQVVLLTTTAADFFLRFGFQPISRAEIPRASQASVEFQEACPASATVMSLMLEAGQR